MKRHLLPIVVGFLAVAWLATPSRAQDVTSYLSKFLVDLRAQTLGVGLPLNSVTLTGGASVTTGKVPIYLLHTETPFTCTTSDSGVTAATLTLKASSMQTNGDRIFIHAEGLTSANANSRTVTLSFGGTTTANLTSSSSGNNGWSIDAWVTRLTASTQLLSAFGNMNNVNGAMQTNTGPSETLTGDVAIVIKESCPTAADFTFKAMSVVLYPA